MSRLADDDATKTSIQHPSTSQVAVASQ